MMAEQAELLFFDTFSHESSEELNLDLVQFPKPVYVNEVRIIPLGARVQADFPGGVRLGATNPGQFNIEFFVNDLGKPGASTFESLGGFEYNQNGCIHLECRAGVEESRQIPTDGLVLRGWYTTVTLAVYGTLTKAISAEQPSNMQQSSTGDIQSVTMESSWQTEPACTEYAQQTYASQYQSEPYQEYHHAEPHLVEYYGGEQKDPRYQQHQHSTPETEWSDGKSRREDTPGGRYSRSLSRERGRSTSGEPPPPPPREYYPKHKRAYRASQERDRDPERKRPRTPTSPAEKELSPGDVESISEDEVDRAEAEAKKEAVIEISLSKRNEAVEEPAIVAAEPFEPILSDEDICDETESFQDDYGDYAAYSNNDDVIKLFNPILDDLHWFKSPNEEDEGELPLNVKELLRSTACGEQTGEVLVDICERIAQALGDGREIGKASEEEAAILKRLISSGLDFEKALAQPQPGYKIRHVKAGVRLAASCWRIAPLEGSENLLLSLFERDHMALSIRLLIVRTLDSLLRTRTRIDSFITEGGYGRLVRLLSKSGSARVEFALAGLLTKINLHEALGQLRVKDCPPAVARRVLGEATRAFRDGGFEMAQPRRFLPVSAQFEVPRDDEAGRSRLIDLFSEHKTLECLLLVRASRGGIEAAQFLKELLRSEIGLEYVARNPEVARALVKAFSSPEDTSVPFVVSEAAFVRARSLGVELAYKCECLYRLRALRFGNEDEDSEHLHAIYCLAFTGTGKRAVAEVLSFKDNGMVVIEKAGQISELKTGYAIELLWMAASEGEDARLLRKHSSVLGSIVDSVRVSSDDSATRNRLEELKLYLRPLRTEGASEDIRILCESLKAGIERAPPSPPECVTALRCLKRLCVAKKPSSDYGELKYGHCLLQLLANDGYSLVLSLASAIVEHFEQPALHATVISGSTSLAALAPALELLAEILAHLIRCRDTSFRDLTPVPILARCYELVSSAVSASESAERIDRCRRAVVDALLAYTQPLDEDESLNKTLWSLALSELLRYAANAPHSFAPACRLMCELLPLPLPLVTPLTPSTDEERRALALRAVWSAHLHPHAASLTQLLRQLSPAADRALLRPLRRLCFQLADLAPNTALIVARAVLDAALSPDADPSPRPLHLLAYLTTRAPLKCAVLALLCVSSPPDTPHHLQSLCSLLRSPSSERTYSYALELVQNLCDCEIRLGPKGELHNSLPPREALSQLTAALVDRLAASPPRPPLLPVLRSLLLLTEHDYGFFHLATALLQRAPLFGEVLKRYMSDRETVNAVLELLRLLVSLEGGRERTLRIPVRDLRKLLAWSETPDEDHSLRTLAARNPVSSDDSTDLGRVLADNLSSLLRLLDSTTDPDPETDPAPLSEPLLPPPDLLSTQFSKRAAFVLVSEDHVSSSSVDDADEIEDEPDDESESDLDLIPVDLAELCRQLLSADFDLASRVEKLLRVCPRPHDSRDEPDKLDHQKKKTGKPADGKTKKPYVTPMRGRGFPRVPPQRGDLFRSRPPNTSRPPSLHVDDFVALETCGAQPTGPTGYNKLSRDLLGARVARNVRGRSFVSPDRLHFRPL